MPLTFRIQSVLAALLISVAACSKERDGDPKSFPVTEPPHGAATEGNGSGESVATEPPHGAATEGNGSGESVATETPPSTVNPGADDSGLFETTPEGADRPQLPAQKVETLGSHEALVDNREAHVPTGDPIGDEVRGIGVAELRRRFREGEKRPQMVARDESLAAAVSIPCVRKSAKVNSEDLDLHFGMALVLKTDALGHSFANSGGGRSKTFRGSGSSGEMLGYPERPLGSTLEQLEIVRESRSSLGALYIIENILVPSVASLPTDDAIIWAQASQQYQVSQYDKKALALSYSICLLDRLAVHFDSGAQLNGVSRDALKAPNRIVGNLAVDADQGTHGSYVADRQVEIDRLSGVVLRGVLRDSLNYKALTFAAGDALVWDEQGVLVQEVSITQDLASTLAAKTRTTETTVHVRTPLGTLVKLAPDGTIAAPTDFLVDSEQVLDMGTWRVSSAGIKGAGFDWKAIVKGGTKVVKLGDGSLEFGQMLHVTFRTRPVYPTLCLTDGTFANGGTGESDLAAPVRVGRGVTEISLLSPPQMILFHAEACIPESITGSTGWTITDAAPPCMVVGNVTHCG